MKKINLLLVIIAMLIAGNSAMAQEDTELQKQIESKMDLTEAQRKTLLERPAERILERINPAEELAIAKCPLGMQSTVTAGINDGLAGTFEPAYLHPMFAALVPNPKKFDDPALNRYFGHSFMLNKYKPCDSKICRANLLIRVCNSGKDYWINDRLYVGKTANNVFSPVFFAGNIWSNQNEAGKCKTINIPLNPALLNSNPPYIDVLMQDDSTIDYMQLTLYY